MYYLRYIWPGPFSPIIRKILLELFRGNLEGFPGFDFPVITLASPLPVLDAVAAPQWVVLSIAWCLSPRGGLPFAGFYEKDMR